MKTNKTVDERVVTERRRINSEAFGIVMIVLLGSVLLQQFVFDTPFAHYAFEFICFIIASIYILVRNLMLGNNLFGENVKPKTSIIVRSVIAGLSGAVANGVYRNAQYGEASGGHLREFAASVAIVFICGTLGTLVVLYLIYALNIKKQKQIEKQFDEDDDE